MTADLALVPGRSYLIEVDQHDIDVLAEVLNAQGQIMARADHPERRSATQRAIVTAPVLGAITVRVSGQEEANTTGAVFLRAFDLASLEGRPDCLAAVKDLAQGDADYATAREIAKGHTSSPTRSAREIFQRAAVAYEDAERALIAAQDQPLRGQTQLALAGVEYLDLSDWAKAARWSRAAAETLGERDPYRRARAEALEADAWMELGSSSPAGQVVTGYGMSGGELLDRARGALRRLDRFHVQRGERYDAGLQVANIGLTYLYESRFRECAAASQRSARLFASIHEDLRRAVSWQNEALCMWGLGRLPEAQRLFEAALADIGPEPYPQFYIGTLTNTALMDYALGRFDESLRLYDSALAFAKHVQAPREEAYCLYGVGVNYDALGDPERAREFLERALVLQTAAIDGRGRMSSLRALAAVNAREGRMDDAVALDREALTLAAAPTSRVRITIQLAAHTGVAGHSEEALALLNGLLAQDSGADTLIRSEALLQRAVLLRQAGRAEEALTDLSGARPGLHRLGSITEEFAADLEQARSLRLMGQTRAALAAVDRGLAQSDVMRLQTSNPDLRAQLQSPLRAAYDLKVELLRARYDAAVAAGNTEEARGLAAAAFATADASRARTFADVAAQEYPEPIRRALSAQLHRREEIYRELAARRFTLESRIDRAGSNDPRARHLMSDIAELERQADAVNIEIAQRIPARETQRTGVARPGLSIPAGTVLVAYWLGSEGSYAWAVSQDAVQWVRLASTEVIAERAASLQRSLTRLVDVPLQRRLSDAAALYELIVSPIAPAVDRARLWVIIPDGALDYVPFAALRRPEAGTGSFVVGQHDVALTPAAWTLRNRSPEAHTRRALLIVADPVYQADDPRLPTARNLSVQPRAAGQGEGDPERSQYQRLTFTAEEAAGIAAQFPAAEVDELLGVNATRERLLSLDWSDYRFIHIATHGIVDAQVPGLSSLMLGSYDADGHPVDGAVRVADLSLRTLRADVAVFSACDTALGKHVPSEGLVGIGSTTLARGAHAVVASLWPVSDEIGAHLMTELYRHMLRDSMSAPAALGAAMRSVVARDPSADPALWAAFQVSVSALGQGPPTHDNASKAATTTARPREMP